MLGVFRHIQESRGNPQTLKEGKEVALYKYPNLLQQSQHIAFDQIHPAGTITPYSGVYRCEGCGHEVSSTYGHPLPPQNHHQHTFAQGQIRWRLVVTHAAS